MKDYLFCHIDNCDFKVGVSLNATEEECEDAEQKYKEHLKSHGLDTVVNLLYALSMIVREDGGADWKIKNKFCFADKKSSEESK